MGLCLCECEKKRGESGCVRFLWKPTGKVSGLSMCRGFNFGRDRFRGGSEYDTARAVPLSSVLECFDACVSSGVVMFCLSSSWSEEVGRRSLLVGGSPCNGALMATDCLLESLAIALSASTADPSRRFVATSSASLLLLVGDGMAGSEICTRSGNRPLNSFWDVNIDLGSGFMDMKGEEIWLVVGDVDLGLAVNDGTGMAKYVASAPCNDTLYSVKSILPRSVHFGEEGCSEWRRDFEITQVPSH